jgi:phosphoribosylanthranilate isomerase
MKIKFCGFTRAEDIHAAVACGVDAIGLNVARGPRKISVEQARDFAALLPPFIARVALFVDADENTIVSAMQHTRCQVVQLHGHEPPELADRLRQRFLVIKAFAIKNVADLHAAQNYPADAYLFDAAVPGVAGGTGVAWDHHVLKGISFSRPIILAGGLNPDTVAPACAVTHPYAVDVASGIESAPGIKDHARMHAFMRALGR